MPLVEGLEACRAVWRRPDVESVARQCLLRCLPQFVVIFDEQHRVHLSKHTPQTLLRRRAAFHAANVRAVRNDRVTTGLVALELERIVEPTVTQQAPGCDAPVLRLVPGVKGHGRAIAVAPRGTFRLTSPRTRRCGAWGPRRQREFGMRHMFGRVTPATVLSALALSSRWAERNGWTRCWERGSVGMSQLKVQRRDDPEDRERGRHQIQTRPGCRHQFRALERRCHRHGALQGRRHERSSREGSGHRHGNRGGHHHGRSTRDRCRRRRRRDEDQHCPLAADHDPCG